MTVTHETGARAASPGDFIPANLRRRSAMGMLPLWNHGPCDTKPIARGSRTRYAVAIKTFLLIFAGVLALSATLFLTGCDTAEAAPAVTGAAPGRQCTIQFRRDVLGIAAPLPVSPMSGSFNGAETSVSGTFKRFHEEWIIIDRGGRKSGRPGPRCCC